MMPTAISLTPAAQPARSNSLRFPHESREYRQAFEALLTKEIELRRHTERVAAQRRALPPGGKVAKEYHFNSERGPVNFWGRPI